MGPKNRGIISNIDVDDDNVDGDGVEELRELQLNILDQLRRGLHVGPGAHTGLDRIGSDQIGSDRMGKVT